MRVFVQHQLLARTPAAPAVRAGAVKALSAEILAQLLDGMPVDDGSKRQAQLVKRVAERRRKDVIDGVVVDDDDVLDRPYLVAYRRLVFRVGQAFERIGHVFSSHRPAITELHILAQGETIGLAVLRDLPLFGQERAHRLQVVVQRYQRVGQHEHHLAHPRGGRADGVIGIGIGHAQHGHRGGLLGHGRQAEDSGRNAHAQQRNRVEDFHG